MIRLSVTTAIAAALLTCCSEGSPAEQTGPAPEQAQAPSNRVDVPAQVRRNLGIEFVEVSRRQVAHTLRLPAQVELLPAATRYYGAPYAGRVQLRATPLQRVAAGEVLYTVDSHEWRAVQRELSAADNAILLTEARLAAMPPLLAACEAHEQSLRAARGVTAAHIQTLQRAEQDVGGQAQKLASARVELAQLDAQIADASEKHTETTTRGRELAATLATERDRMQLLLRGAAATLELPAEALASRWRTLEQVEVRAARPGVVTEVAPADGALVAAHEHVLATVDPRAVRCRARALQSDLGALRDGMPAAIVPGGPDATTARVTGEVQLAPVGDPRARTLDVFVTPTEEDLGFVRPGLAVHVEVTTAATVDAPLAIPLGCVLTDGLDRVFFRRDPRDPDKVIRVVADLGVDDGVWVEVKSGITDGDHVVRAGAYELVLASSSATPKGGHFHADGTWHEDH